MIELIKESFMETDATKAMILINMLFVMASVILALMTLRFVYSIYKLDKEKNDDEHKEMQGQILFMMNEIKANRLKDNEDTNTNRKLIKFLAEQSNIKIPSID